MTRSILGAIVGGVVVGALAFFVPHFLLGILIFLLIVRLLHCGVRGYGCYGHGHHHRHERLFYMADRIRKMSEEEYAEFKTKMDGGCCNKGYHRHRHCCGDSKSAEKECCESKKEETTK